MSPMKPNIFIILGMPRTGTTFLYHTLLRHPKIYLPYRKETYFFSTNFHKGQDWFYSLYGDMPDDQIGVDIGPVYFLDPLAIDRIIEYDPSIKVVLGVREPVAFAVSLYTNVTSFGYKMPPITEWVTGFQWNLSPKANIDVCLENSFLSTRVDELRRLFNDNLLLYDFRSFDRSPLTILKAIESFVDVPPHFSEDNVDDVVINASGRRNIRFVNYMIRQQRVLDVIYKILPTKAIRVGRGLFDRLSVNNQAQKTILPSDEELEFLRDFFAADQRYINELFSSNPIQLGSGEPVCV